ncbi:hypothetical protein B0J11DRAFT_512295 [Dendryphion nanum]|uniref:Uncharacterized protein n=1 Tax=Dendryphion nanum TaxID=256645 RepID=A0A9P9I957_9PLEO|nr:hypothetical protein B0J11DRAFT_512295 [Dendryphion nanum]
MSFQWDIPQSIDEQGTAIALDFNDFAGYNSYGQCLSSDQISQLVINPEHDSLAMTNMNSTAWEWRESTDPSNQSNLQTSQLQSYATQNETLEDENCLKYVVSELGDRLDKWEENMELSIVKWEKKAVKQEEMIELRISKVEQMVRDLQYELEEERAKLLVELQAWVEQVKTYVDSALSTRKSK